VNESAATAAGSDAVAGHRCLDVLFSQEDDAKRLTVPAGTSVPAGGTPRPGSTADLTLWARCPTVADRGARRRSHRRFRTSPGPGHPHRPGVSPPHRHRPRRHSAAPRSPLTETATPTHKATRPRGHEATRPRGGSEHVHRRQFHQEVPRQRARTGSTGDHPTPRRRTRPVARERERPGHILRRGQDHRKDRRRPRKEDPRHPRRRRDQDLRRRAQTGDRAAHHQRTRRNRREHRGGDRPIRCRGPQTPQAGPCRRTRDGLNTDRRINHREACSPHAARGSHIF